MRARAMWRRRALLGTPNGNLTSFNNRNPVKGIIVSLHCSRSVARGSSHTSGDGPIENHADLAASDRRTPVRRPPSSPDTNPPSLCGFRHPAPRSASVLWSENKNNRKPSWKGVEKFLCQIYFSSRRKDNKSIMKLEFVSHRARFSTLLFVFDVFGGMGEKRAQIYLTSISRHVNKFLWNSNVCVKNNFKGFVETSVNVTLSYRIPSCHSSAIASWPEKLLYIWSTQFYPSSPLCLLTFDTIKCV